jgi:hypothetical protein
MKGIVWFPIIMLIILGILGIIGIAALYTIISLLKLFVCLIVGVFFFLYFFALLRKTFKIDKYISLGLSFLITCALIVWIYQSWIYITALIILGLIMYVAMKIFGFGIKDILGLIKEIKGEKEK